ncbi:hypothetical protein C8J56DRAFT_1087792 [Mycena floridula]|nr:hypothetical protein C8J56DRAFT_1087792 [Mycena floridula]
MTEVLPQAVGSPIETLSREVLELVFLECCQNTFPSALNMKTFSWVSGQVCSYWRQIALSLPPMWNKVYLAISQDSEGRTQVLYDHHRNAHYMDHHSDDDHDDDKPSLSQYSATILQERLLRCGGLPVSVTIDYFVQYSNKEPTAEVITLVSLIGAHSKQWEVAKLHIRNTYLTGLLFNRVNGHLPQLGRLEWFDLPRTLPNAIVAPRLRSLDVRYGLSSTQSFPQWSQLTEVDIDAAHFGQALIDLRLLQTSENLRRLNLRSSFSCPVQHERLKFNQLRVLSNCFPATLDVFLELSALEALYFQIHAGIIVTLPASIKRLSFHSLKSLSLPYIRSDKDVRIIIDVLNMLARLQTVALAYTPRKLAIILFNHLTVDSSQLEATPLPNLQHLCMNINNLKSIGDLPSFIELVESRFSVDYEFPRLKSVECPKLMPGALKVAPKLHSRLSRLERRGLMMIS